MILNLNIIKIEILFSYNGLSGYSYLKTESVSSKEFAITCKQCWKTFYFSRDYSKHLPCYIRQSKLKL